MGHVSVSDSAHPGSSMLGLGRQRNKDTPKGNCMRARGSNVSSLTIGWALEPYARPIQIRAILQEKDHACYLVSELF